MSSRSSSPASRLAPTVIHAKERMVEPSRQERESGTSSSTSRTDYPNRSVLGGQVGFWSSDLNSLPVPQTREAVAEIEEWGYAALSRWCSASKQCSYARAYRGALGFYAVGLAAYLRPAAAISSISRSVARA